MSSRKVFWFMGLAVGAALAGCATQYQPAGFTGGYKDVHIRDNLYYVEFGGNAMLNTTTAVEYFHRRAREVCAENGYSDYLISQERDISALQGVGTGSSVAVMQKPGFAGYVECQQ